MCYQVATEHIELLFGKTTLGIPSNQMGDLHWNYRLKSRKVIS